MDANISIAYNSIQFEFHVKDCSECLHDHEKNTMIRQRIEQIMQ